MNHYQKETHVEMEESTICFGSIGMYFGKNKVKKNISLNDQVGLLGSWRVEAAVTAGAISHSTSRDAQSNQTDAFPRGHRDVRKWLLGDDDAA